MSFHAMVRENLGVESEIYYHTLRSPLQTFLAISYIFSGARKKNLSVTPLHKNKSAPEKPDRDVAEFAECSPAGGYGPSPIQSAVS